MRKVRKLYCFISILLLAFTANSQPALNAPPDFMLTILTENTQAANGATVELLMHQQLIKVAITNKKGVAAFEKIAAGTYTFSVTLPGYRTVITDTVVFPSRVKILTVTMQPNGATLQEVSVTARKPLLQHTPGKTVLNVDAAVTNVGATLLEVLEKSPGIIVDRAGGISLQGKSGVLVMIDDKPTYLSGIELNNLLSSMSASQVDQIELITNPPAKYDASGNAGIINIKTKKNKAKGFNGSFSIAAGHGVYPKNNNSLQINYRTGKFNLFLTYSMNFSKYLVDLYALRKYYDDHDALIAVLDQPAYFSGTVLNNMLKTGIDYFVTPKTTIGVALGGTTIQRKGNNHATATWLNSAGAVDSAIATSSNSNNHFKSGTVNINARHTISATQEIAVDFDWLNYDILAVQHFYHRQLTAGSYQEAAQGNIPSTIQIVSGKLDHTLRFGKNSSLISGFKSSHINTDNIAAYQYFDGTDWMDDYGKSNHFLYQENIRALYSNMATKYKRISLQAGLRYEHTSYDAQQMGNVVQKDSAFSRNYGGLFPSGYISYQADSSNGFTFTTGRRIDRPAFQKLNPFINIINKYTYQTGNPFYLPQYSWNMELGYQYKNLFTTAISYSNIKNYFSQLFLTDTISGILYYSEGNVGRAYNFGLSATLVVSPLKWWSLTAQANYNYKQLKGYKGDQNFISDINQLNININNQFSFAKIYTAELSGFYTSRARNDLQELLYPTGQLSVGVSKQVLKKKGALKLSARDIFYTTAMEGFTQFYKATEYFILRRDTRVLNLAFTYRFGKNLKTTRRSGGSAGDEMERVGSGG